MPEEKPKLTVSPNVLKKIKEWDSQGRTVYRAICSNLGCLAEVFTPNNPEETKVMCPRCSSMGGGFWNVQGTVKPADFVAKKFVPVKVYPKDLSFVVTEPPAMFAMVASSSLVNIDMTISKHWRPVKMPFYLPLDDDATERAYKREVKRLIEQIESGEFLKENWDMVAHACSAVGYKLVEDKKKGRA